MATKMKASARTPPPPPAKKAPPASAMAPLTMDERVHRIEAMGQRVSGYIQFMCQIGAMTGTSAEVKERAVTAFYEQMVLVERQLGHIHDELRLE
jgi:hypothetical protein